MPSNQDPQNSGRFSRPIDPPSLPPWSGKKADEDETPTLSGDEFPDTGDMGDQTEWIPVPLAPPANATASPPEDPRALAKRLAEEAKLRLAQAEPAPPKPAPTEDPRELAMRLASEAKKRLANTADPVVPPVAEDPRELAKRLAEEAKKRLGSTPSPAAERAAPAKEDPRALAQRLAAEAKKRLTPGPTEKRQAAPSQPPASLSERAAARPMSALEALAKAREVEARRKETPAPTPARKSKKRKKSAEAAPAPVVAAAPEPEPAPAPAPAQPTAPPAVARPTLSPAAVLLELMPGAAVDEPVVVGNADVFRALWRAHRTRAQHDGDLVLVATASVLIDAIDRIDPGRLAAARITMDNEVWAAWIDLDRGALLGVAKPADVYLAGT